MDAGQSLDHLTNSQPPGPRLSQRVPATGPPAASGRGGPARGYAAGISGGSPGRGLALDRGPEGTLVEPGEDGPGLRRGRLRYQFLQLRSGATEPWPVRRGAGVAG